MHLRFARRTSAIRYYSLSRQISRGVLNFCNTAETSRFTAAENFPSLQITPSKVSRNPNCSRDHLLSAPDRENTSDSHIYIRCMSMCDSLRDPTGILPSLGVFLGCEDLICPMHVICKGGYTPSGSFLPSKHVKQRKGDVDIVAYSDTLVRRIYRKMGEDALKSNNMFGKGCETSQFYSLAYTSIKTLGFSLFLNFFW